ncbi:MAG: FxDxF family PEP-CTERM protein [Pseudomonadota bacterium]
MKKTIKTISHKLAFALIIWFCLPAGAVNAAVQNVNSWNSDGGGLKAVFENKVKTSFEDSVHFSFPNVTFGKKSSNHVSLKYDSGISLEKFELWGDGKQLVSGKIGGSDSHLSFFGDKNIEDYELKFKGFNDFVDGLYCGEIVISPVPEPQTFAMLLIGLGLVGFSARRRRNDTVD